MIIIIIISLLLTIILSFIQFIKSNWEFDSIFWALYFTFLIICIIFTSVLSYKQGQVNTLSKKQIDYQLITNSDSTKEWVLIKKKIVT